MQTADAPAHDARPAASWLDRALSPNPARRAVELWWLVFTPVWGAASAIVMVGGLAERWGDVELLAFGILAAAGAIVPACTRSEERGTPFFARVGTKLSASVVVLAFGLNYSQTQFFFDVLHMHYGFATEWNVRNNPIFLYFLTVAYFATYCALVSLSFRLVRAATEGAPRVVRWAGYALAPFAMAALETILNANPFMARLFCYDDLGFMSWFGTLCYGVSFVFALPTWMAIDDTKDRRLPFGAVVAFGLAAVYADSLVLDAIQHGVAPRFTTVVEDAPGLRDYDGSCLERPASNTTPGSR